MRRTAQSDESEACFYHGAVCYDGDHLVVMAEDGHGQDARTSMCYDFRHFVASPSCGYNGPHKRANLVARLVRSRGYTSQMSNWIFDRLRVVDYSKVAQIRFPALPQRSLPILTGHVIHVSADRLTDERTGQSYFKVRLKPDAESLEKIVERRLVAGMPAEVSIATGQRTAGRYLLDPFIDAMQRSMRER